MDISPDRLIDMTLPCSILHYPLGDQALVLSFGDTISEAINAQILGLLIVSRTGPSLVLLSMFLPIQR